MKSFKLTPHANWQQIVESEGFAFHSLNNEEYWVEDRAFALKPAEVTALSKATQELYSLCLRAVDMIIRENRFEQLGIPSTCIPLIERSWQDRDPAIYGRFDLAYQPGHPPKMLEFNADTPTMLLESAVIQHYWLDRYKGLLLAPVGQFNHIHDSLIAAWTHYRQTRLATDTATVHFACLKGYVEDLKTLEYLADTARHAQLSTKIIFIEDVGWNGREFLDIDDLPIHHLFKLYPWEMMAEEDFFQHLFSSSLKLIEPPWKMLLSNKAILPVLWELFEGHPNLLPSYFEESNLKKPYVRKPFFSREGANIQIIQDEGVTESPGIYDNGKYIYQTYSPLPTFPNGSLMVGSWIANGLSCGIGVRESRGLITTNTSRFVPHFISPFFG